jgi:DNA topoisomerase-1
VLEALDAELGQHFFPDDSSGRDPRLCPGCNAGRLSLKLGRFGAFVGCSNYPECRYTRAFGVSGAAEGESDTSAADMVLGTDPESGKSVAVKKGPYGFYIQLGEAENGGKPKRVAVPRRLKPTDITLDTALGLLSLPRMIGTHPETGEPITAGLGRFGPYIKHGSVYVSLAGDDDVLTIGLNRAVSLLAEAKTGARRRPQLLREIGPHPDGGTVGLYRGRYGPYVSHEGVHASLPKGADPDNFPLEAAIELLATQRAKGGAKGKPAAKARHPARKAASAAKSGSAEAATPAKPAAKRKAPPRAAPAKHATQATPPARKAAKRPPRSAAGE